MNSTSMSKTKTLWDISRSVKWEHALLATLLLICSYLYFSHTITLMRRNDPAGYIYTGVRLAEAGSPTYCHEYNELAGPYFTLHAFSEYREENPRCLYSNRFLGFPLLIALAKIAIPFPSAIYYVAPFLGILGLVGLYMLSASLLDRQIALLATSLLAFNPSYMTMATESWSDVPSLAFLLLGLAFITRGLKRAKFNKGLLGGALLGYACFIRYPNVIILIPIFLYCLALEGRRLNRNAAFWGLTLGFGLLSVLILLTNNSLYGGFLSTGYRPRPQRFDISYFLGRSPVQPSGYPALWNALYQNFSLVGLLLVILGLATMRPREIILLGGTGLVFALFYSFYRWGVSMEARFIFPLFAMIAMFISSGTLAIIRTIAKRKYLGAGLAMLVLIFISLFHLPSTLRDVEARNQGQEKHIQRVEDFTANTEGTSVFISKDWNDDIIIYGQRAAMRLLSFAAICSNSESAVAFQSCFEEGLDRIIEILWQNDIPIYYIDYQMMGVQPFEILSKNYELEITRNEHPTIYKVIRHK